MPLSDEDATALIAELKREMRGLERARRETEAMKADLERKKRDLERAKWEKGLQKRELERLQYEAWLQSENVEMPMFPLLQGPQQSVPTAVALAAEAPATEVMTDTCVFPDATAPDASVERVAIKLTSAAGSSSKICGERRASTHLFDPGSVFPLKVRYYNSSWPIHGSNSSSSNSSNSSGNGSSSSNDTTSNHDSWWETTYVGALLRPFDPGKGCQRDARRGKAVLGVDLPFDRGKARGECSMEGDGLRAEGDFLAFIWLVSITTGDSRVRHSPGRFGLLDFILDGYLHV